MLAMALHELATNALKYGALGQPGAHLSVRWRLERDGDDVDPSLHVEWKERGVVMPRPGSAPVRHGQGRELIERALPYQLRARTSFELGSDGLCCTITLPISASQPPASRSLPSHA
jgi:two-component sensor histidine kinase